jgi:hypothetical protein
MTMQAMGIANQQCQSFLELLPPTQVRKNQGIRVDPLEDGSTALPVRQYDHRDVLDNAKYRVKDFVTSTKMAHTAEL